MEQQPQQQQQPKTKRASTGSEEDDEEDIFETPLSSPCVELEEETIPEIQSPISLQKSDVSQRSNSIADQLEMNPDLAVVRTADYAIIRLRQPSAAYLDAYHKWLFRSYEDAVLPADVDGLRL